MIGKELGRYLVVEALGEGGMAAVYKGFDRRLSRDVAIKVILRGYEGREVFLKRFEREAKAVAQLTHPNIVPVIDYGTEDDVPYLVMEYLPGGTLKDKMGTPIPWEQAARMLAPVARALDYAHDESIIHRDLKPANILITKSGDLMLSDFGIAKTLGAEDHTQLTGTGVGIGTPAYMAPEQGMGDEVDHRVDIYSLGVVFYEMITGRLPYTADTPMAIMLKHINAPLPRINQFVDQVPGEVEEITFKALAKDPSNRYQSMGEFAVALDDLVRSRLIEPAPIPEPVEATHEAAKPPTPAREHLASIPQPIEPAQRGDSQQPIILAGPGIPDTTPGVPGPKGPDSSKSRSKPKRPKWFIWVLIICLASMAASVICWISWQISVKQDKDLREIFTQTAAAGTIHETTPQTNLITPTPPPDPTAPASIAIPAHIAFKAINDDGYYDFFQVNLDGTDLRLLIGDLETESMPLLSPDARQVLLTKSLEGNPDIWRLSVDGNDLYQLTGDPAHDDLPAWSPDSQQVAFSSSRGGSNDIWVMDVDGSGLCQLTSKPKGEIVSQWSPDGSKIAFYSFDDGIINIWVIDTDGTNLLQLTNIQEGVAGFSWSPDGKRIGFFTGPPGSLDIWVVNVDGTGLQQLTTSSNTGLTMSWSPDGRFIVYDTMTNENRDIWMMESEGTNHQPLITDPAHDYAPNWSPDGAYIAFSSSRSGNVDVWIINPDGSGLRQLTTSPTNDHFLQWLP